MLERWAANAASRERTQLEDLLELRDMITELKTHGDNTIMQVYREAADAFRMTPKALQNKVLILREYKSNKLLHWINECGLSLDAIKQVNEASDYSEIKEQPADFLDRITEQGNGDGKPPTAAEVEILILEQNGIKPDEYIFNRRIYKFAAFFGLGSDFVDELKTLVKRYL